MSDRVAAIKREIDNTESEYDREKLTERVAKLAGGVAVIKVGAPTETELRNRKLRIEDALNATRAAVEEGIVAGGGSTLVQLAGELDGLAAGLSGDERTGVEIVQRALAAPLHQIAENAGFDPNVVAEEVRNLAQRCAEAARNTSELIAQSVGSSEQGVEACVEVTATLDKVVGGMDEVDRLVARVAEVAAVQTAPSIRSQLS